MDFYCIHTSVRIYVSVYRIYNYANERALNILYSLLFEFQNMRSTYLSKFLEKRFSARMATYVLPEPVGK